MTIYARIKLAETDYTVLPNSEIIKNPDPEQLEKIYNTYCVVKKFCSVTPIFVEEYTHPDNDVIGYYDGKKLVAFSLMRRYNTKNVEAVQFAWDYENPKLHLGIASLRSECAVYKNKGFEFLYLGEAHEYKRQIDGFEILGPRT
jgi:hypothetical protein